MKLETKLFGEIDYMESDVIVFEEGLYGFETLKRYVYVRNEDEEFQFDWIQSIEEPDLSFVVTSPFLFVEGYDFDLSDKVMETLGIQTTDQLSIISIVNVNKDVAKTTINIQAPLIINNENKKGQQVILDEDFTHKYYIFKNNSSEEV